MNKKGFTLVELLAVIIILSIIISIGFASYSAYIKSAKEKTKKIEIAQIIDSGSAYHKEFKSQKNYLYYVDKDNVKHSCISVKSLIDMGYYKGNVSFLNEELTKENAVVKVTEKNGVANYEVVAPYDKDKDCVYYDYSNAISSTTDFALKNEDDEGIVSLKSTFSKNPYKKNSYTLKLKFGADVYSKIVNYSFPVYVLLVLDDSGSMRGTPYTEAMKASIDLSNNVFKNFKNSYIGLITFSDNAMIRRGFWPMPLLDRDFGSAGGSTNILYALDLAYGEIAKIKATKDGFQPIKYVILLSDGAPNKNYNSDKRCRSFTSECEVALKEYADNIKGVSNTTFVVIGYGMKKDIYKEIASINTTGSICPNSSVQFSDGRKHCYYNSDSNNIGELFDNISDTIAQNVKIPKFSKSKIHIDFDKSIKLYDFDGRKSSTLDLNIDLSDTVNETLNKEYTYTLSTDNINDSLFTCDFDKKICTYTADLFGNYYLNLYDMNGNFSKKLTITTSPKFTITKKLESYIN